MAIRRSSSSISKQVKEYPYPSNVNVSNFVSVKLSGKDKYYMWASQMICLMEAHDMVGFINGKYENPKSKGADEAKNYRRWKRSDSMLKGWILGTLHENVLTRVAGLQTAKQVWEKLGEYGEDNIVEDAPPEEVGKDFSDYMPLYKAALSGSWTEAEKYFDQDEQAMTAKLDSTGYTALHMAVGTGEGIPFVQKLVNMIPKEELLKMVTSENEFTALHVAAIVNNIKAVKILVDKNKELVYAKDKEGLLPVHRALFNSQTDSFKYLLRVTMEEGMPDDFEGEIGVTLLSNAIFSGYYDEALFLVKKLPKLCTTKAWKADTPLMAIAKKADAFRSGTQYNLLEELIYRYAPAEQNNCLECFRYHKDIENQAHDTPAMMHKTEGIPSLVFRNCGTRVLWSLHCTFWRVAGRVVPCIKRMQKEKLVHSQALELVRCLCIQIESLKNHNSYMEHYHDPIIEASHNGAYEVVQEIVNTFPQAIWCTDEHGYCIIQLAIMNRCEKVYNLIAHQMSQHKHFHRTLKDKSRNNILHLAGKLAPKHKLDLVSGAALQMQRELQWFKEVETFVNEKYKAAKNSQNQTPQMVFTKAHEGLVKNGEEWMKKTAESYTITAALIITVVFAAAITVPGGNNQDTGIPLYNKHVAFEIFAVSDAVSLFTATTSLLLFLSILTARFAEQDFRITLPMRLIFGLATLFLSTTCMLIAFSATLYIMFGQGKNWILLPIGLLACLPIASFVTLQFPLLRDVFVSTFGRGIFHKQGLEGSNHLSFHPLISIQYQKPATSLGLSRAHSSTVQRMKRNGQIALVLERILATIHDGKKDKIVDLYISM